MNSDRPIMPRAQRVYGETVYWLTVVCCVICTAGPLLAMISPENNVMNPYFTFAAIFDGHSPAEIWTIAAGHFPGGHFYWRNLFTGDGFTQLGLALGTTSAAWALFVAAGVYAVERIYLYAFFSVFVAIMILFSASGIVSF